MDWKEKYSGRIANLNRMEKDAGVSAILMAMSNILRQEKINYSIYILGDFCQFFVNKDKMLMLDQLEKFSECGWFTNEEIDHAAILKKAIIDSESELIEATSSQRSKKYVK